MKKSSSLPEVERGEDHILITSLLPLLPNLAALTANTDPTRPIWYDSAIEQAASATKPTLCKLTHIRLYPCDASDFRLAKVEILCHQRQRLGREFD